MYGHLRCIYTILANPTYMGSEANLGQGEGQVLNFSSLQLD